MICKYNYKNIIIIITSKKGVLLSIVFEYEGKKIENCIEHFNSIINESSFVWFKKAKEFIDKNMDFVKGLQ